MAQSRRSAKRQKNGSTSSLRESSPVEPEPETPVPATPLSAEEPVTSGPGLWCWVPGAGPASVDDPSSAGPFGLRTFEPGSDSGLCVFPGGPPRPGFGGFPPPDDDIRPETIDPSMGLHRVGGLEEQRKYLFRRVILPITRKGMSGLASVLFEPVKGVIFYGPPGTGKTLLAKSLAAELGGRTGQKFSFFMRKGTDVYSKWVGESEKTLRRLFAKAEEMKPSIIFLDEIDGLAPARTDQSHHHTVSVTTTLLGLIDSVIPGNVLIIGATNRLDSLDPAILRPGRFDKHIFMTPPNEAGRLEILNIKLEAWGPNKPDQCLLRELSRGTTGFTGADLEKLIKVAVDMAMDRQFPEPEPTLPALNQMKVAREDWLKALGSMAKSNSNVFGNSLYSGEMEEGTVRPLISGIVETVRKRVTGFFPACDLGIQGTELKALLVWGTTDPTLTVLDTVVLPAVIARLDSNTLPTFILSLSTGPQMVRIIEQAIQSAQEKNTVLYVPRIDTLYASMVSTKQAPGPVLSKLSQVRGKSLLVLASGACDLQNLSLQTQQLFHGRGRSLQMGQPSAEERGDFYYPLFKGKAQLRRSGCGTGTVSGLKWAVDLTDGDELWSMLSLHGELAKACIKYDGKETLMTQLEKILSAYEKNKLRPG